uniref:Retinoblastoma-associated protein N-terminal domain-containing protein n=1 Tax=Amphimedon queenslandica TaxID=400682 RepID=A0A1X7THD3_AMPQE
MDGEQYSGNSISLTQIVRTTKIKLIEFFRKIKKWLEMAKLPQLYLEKVETLERKFEVISVIFKKYRREFSTIFQLQDGDVSDGMGGATGVGGARGGSTSRPRSRKPTR